MEISLALLICSIMLGLEVPLGIYFLYLKINSMESRLEIELQLVADELEKTILIYKADLKEEIKNIISILDDVNVFLRTKGLTISLVSGLKEKMEEILQTSYDEKVEKQGAAPIATPASYTGKG